MRSWRVTGCKGFLYDPRAWAGSSYRAASFVGLARSPSRSWRSRLQKYVLVASIGKARSSSRRSRRRGRRRRARRASVRGGGPGARHVSCFERSAVLQEPGRSASPVDVPLLVGSAPLRVESRRDRWAVGRAGRARSCRPALLRRRRDARCRTCCRGAAHARARVAPWVSCCRSRRRKRERLRGRPRDERRPGPPWTAFHAPFLKRLSSTAAATARAGRGSRRKRRSSTCRTGLRLLELAFAPGMLSLPADHLGRRLGARVPAPRALLGRVASPTRRPPWSSRLRSRSTGARASPARAASACGCLAPRCRSWPCDCPSAADLSRQARVGEARLAGVGGRSRPPRRGAARRAVRDVLAADELDPDRDSGDRAAGARGRRRRQPAARLSLRRGGAGRAALHLPGEREGRDARRALGNRRSTRPATTSESARERAAPGPRASAPGARRARRPPNRKRWGVAASLPGVGPPLETIAVRLRADLPDGPAGLLAVPLDAAVLAHSEEAERQLHRPADRGFARPAAAVSARPPAGAAPDPAPRSRSRRGGGRAVSRSHQRLSTDAARTPSCPPARLVLCTSAASSSARCRRSLSRLPTSLAGEGGRAAARRVGVVASRRPGERGGRALTLQLPTFPRDELLLRRRRGRQQRLAAGVGGAAAAVVACAAVPARAGRAASGFTATARWRRRATTWHSATSVLGEPGPRHGAAGEQEHARSETEVLRPRAFWALMLGAAFVLLGLIVHLVRGARVSRRLKWRGERR